MASIKSYKLIRSKKRRTIALTVAADATLIVRAPENTSIKYIEHLIVKNSEWIRKAILRLSTRPKVQKKEYISGEGFFFLGKLHKLKIQKNIAEPLVLRENFILSEKEKGRAREVFIEWYKNEAKKKIAERVEWRAKRSGMTYKSVRITSAERRWGSCGSNGNLSFSWRLIMAPLSVIDYVVAHEFAHLEHKNHSPAFWTTVKAMCSGYERSKDWLRENERTLTL